MRSGRVRSTWQNHVAALKIGAAWAWCRPWSAAHGRSMDARPCPRRGQNRIVLAPLWRCAAFFGSSKDQQAEGTEPSAVEEETTCGLSQSWPSSKAVAASAIALDPYRGWGRYPSAHIRAQRVPDVSPAGTGNEYRRPEGSPGGLRWHTTGQPSGDPSSSTGASRSNEARGMRLAEK